MSRQFFDVLLDNASIIDKVVRFNIDRRRSQAVDTLTLELADDGLYSSLDFGALPTIERLQVGTAEGDPKTDGITGGDSTSLNNDLFAYWKHDLEIGGILFDSAGNNDVVVQFSHSFATGKIGLGSQFIKASTRSLEVVDNADMSTGDVDFVLASWVFMDTKTTTMTIMSKFNPTGNLREYNLDYDVSSDRFRFQVSSDGTAGGITSVLANSFGSPGTGVFIFVIAWHDSVNDTINIQINNGAVDSTAHSTGLTDLGSAVRIGAVPDNTFHWDGRIDETSFWKNRILTSSERAKLYNLGAGLQIPFINPEPLNVLTSPSSDFISEGVTTDDLLHVITADSTNLTLVTGLVAFWKLGEAAGATRLDSVGNNDLTDNNTVGQVSPGKIGDAASFASASNQFLSIADNGQMSTGDIDFTWAGWVRFTTKSANMVIAGKYDPTGNNREWVVEYRLSSDTLRMDISPNGTTNGDAQTDAFAFGSPPTGTFFFVVIWHDSVNDTINIQINNGTVNSSSYVNGCSNQGADYRIGERGDGTDNLNGDVDAVGWWKRVLSTQERADLFNGGLGREHPFEITEVADLITDLVSFWKLDEASNVTRLDSVGSNDLTDVGSNVDQVSGIIGSAAGFSNANTETLTHVDNASLSVGDIGFTFTGWFYLDNKSTAQAFISKWDEPGSSREYLFFYNDGPDRLQFAVSSNGTNDVRVTASSFGSPPTGTFFFVAIWHDPVNDTINIQVNNGAVDSASFGLGVFDGTALFSLGSNSDITLYLDGRIDEVSFYKKILTSVERAELYNSGIGRTHPFTGIPQIGQDEGTFLITAVTATTLTTNHTFGINQPASPGALEFIILTSQGKFFAEKTDVLETPNQVSIPSVWGRNSLARLADPFARRITRSFAKTTTLFQVVSDLVKDAGMDESKIQIDISDYTIPANVLRIFNRLPIEVINDLARKTNGYARSTKDGDLHIKKDIFHFDALPIAQIVGDNEIAQFTERQDFPEFGNRILVRSALPESSQDVAITLEVETSCIRGDGKASADAEAVVTDIRGAPAQNGTTVAWTIDDESLFTWAVSTSLTGEKVVMGETKRSSGLLEVTTELPIAEVIGVFQKLDGQKTVNHFIGGTFAGRAITLGKELPFSDTLVVVDYIAKGIARNELRSVAAAPDGKSTFVHAAVGKIRDSAEICINNNRNLRLSLVAIPSDINICLEGQQSSSIIATIRDNGADGLQMGVNWSLRGPGSITTVFTLVKNDTIPSEFASSQNVFTVNTRFNIVSINGVFLADDGKTGTNFFTNSQDRTGSFDGKQIILGTNLPSNRERVIIDYVARSIAKTTYNAPTGQTEADVAFVEALINDGTELGISEEEQILLSFNCPDDDGIIPGFVGGLPENPGPSEPDCETSSAPAKACNIGSPGETVFVECVCGFLLAGADCPTNEEDCRAMCQADYNKNGFSSLHCETETADEFCKRETKNASLLAIQTCENEHEQATVDKCVEKCLDHGQEIGELQLSCARDPCVFSCAAGSLQFTASGGVEPFVFSTTKGSITAGGVLTPPSTTNNFGATPAYCISIRAKRCRPLGGPFDCEEGGTRDDARYNCDGVLTVCSGQASVCNGQPEPVPGCCNNTAFCCNFGCPGCGSNCASLIVCDGGGCALLSGSGVSEGQFLDIRSQAMIDDNCNPCRIGLDGAVVTVTDAQGNEVSEAVVAIEDT